MSIDINSFKQYVAQNPAQAARISADALDANPHMLVEIVEAALEAAPGRSLAIADAAIKAVPARAAQTAALAVRANPQRRNEILKLALTARPNDARNILNQAMQANPEYAQAIRASFQDKLSRPASGQPGPVEAQTQVEAPLVDADAQAPPAASSIPAPVYRTVQGGPLKPGQEQPPAAGPVAAVPGLSPAAGQAPDSERRFSRPVLFALAVGLVLLCGLVSAGALAGYYYFASGQAENGASQTSTAGPQTETAVVEPIATETAPEPTEAAPSDTPEQAAETPPPTATQASQPTFTAGQDMFCRAGPSSIYVERRTLNAGDVVPVLGKGVSPVDNTSIWWLVEKDGAECYVSSSLGSTEGDTSSVPEVDPPATPTATLPPTATSDGYPAPASPTAGTPYP